MNLKIIGNDYDSTINMLKFVLSIYFIALFFDYVAGYNHVILDSIEVLAQIHLTLFAIGTIISYKYGRESVDDTVRDYLYRE